MSEGERVMNEGDGEREMNEGEGEILLNIHLTMI